MSLEGLEAATADALIGIDTLWGGDVMNPSGVGRFIADCWFSDEPLPPAYTDPNAAAMRANGGVGARAGFDSGEQRVKDFFGFETGV